MIHQNCQQEALMHEIYPIHLFYPVLCLLADSQEKWGKWWPTFSQSDNRTVTTCVCVAHDAQNTGIMLVDNSLFYHCATLSHAESYAVHHYFIQATSDQLKRTNSYIWLILMHHSPQLITAMNWEITKPQKTQLQLITTAQLQHREKVQRVLIPQQTVA